VHRSAHGSPLQRVLRHVGVSVTKVPREPTPETALTATAFAPIVDADAAQPEHEVELEPRALHLARELPRNLAIVHIYQEMGDRFRVEGRGSDVKPLAMGPEDLPDLALADMQVPRNDRRFKTPSQMLSLMGLFSFSPITRELVSWLNAFRDRHPQDGCLVITDYTGAELPWELLDLATNAKSPTRYLGALIPTARWQHFTDDERQDLPLAVQPQRCRGNVLAYVNHAELEGGGAETEVLRRFAPVMDSLPDLEAHLQREDAACGLIYMACHGLYDDSVFEFILGSRRDPTQQWVLGTLYGKPLRLLHQSNSIVFINACHSARLIRDRNLRYRHLHGFVELFMRKGAQGVIGTMGKVSDTYAATIALQLLHASARSEGVQPARLLRDLRRVQSDRVGLTSTEEELKLLVYVFMYVFYGNPMIELQLTRPGDADAQ
jgi:hypothetical protein